MRRKRPAHVFWGPLSTPRILLSSLNMWSSSKSLWVRDKSWCSGSQSVLNPPNFHQEKSSLLRLCRVSNINFRAFVIWHTLFSQQFWVFTNNRLLETLRLSLFQDLSSHRLSLEPWVWEWFLYLFLSLLTQNINHMWFH